MRLYLIRHAQSINNALEDQRHRIAEPHLTEIGLRQADCLAQAFGSGGAPDPKLGDAGRPFDRLYTSPMRRALETTRPLATALGVRPYIWVDIHECGGMWQDHGEDGGIVGYPGLSRSEIAAAFPDYIVPPELTEAGWWDRAQESSAECRARVARVAGTLRAWAARDERVALVSHGDFINNLLQALLDASAPVWIHMYNTGITVVDMRADGSLGLRFTNRVDHLPPELIT
jgi:2,3-bisphosphoglycerate-dependent phosphoglycerate mutase/probable phosphoglycerate mutase